MDVDTTEKRISLRPGDIEHVQAVRGGRVADGAALREIKFRRVSGPAGKGE